MPTKEVTPGQGAEGFHYRNERNIQNKMTSLTGAVDELNKCHTLWVSKGNISDEQLASPNQKFNSNWLESAWEENSDGRGNYGGDDASFY